MKVTEANFFDLLPSLQLAATKLKGSAKRMFLGQVALDLGKGGSSKVAKYLPISRQTLRKGIQEVHQGVGQEDKFSERGRKPLDETNPALIATIKEIVDKASQTDPKFTSTRLYTRLSANSVREELIKRGYEESTLPSGQTIWNYLKKLGYKRKKVAKTKPKKKLKKQTLFSTN